MALNIQLLSQGFGSYLKNILPDEVATAAGAFATAMRQVKNIDSIPIEKFAQVASNIESTKNLDQINGTNVPVSVDLANTGSPLIALGDGPYGTYTMSNILGAMSGLPYPWAKIESSIQSLQTTKLANIYDQLYLAVEWEPATMSIAFASTYNVLVQPYIEPDPSAFPPVAGQPRIDDWYYTITFDLADQGGGYYRGRAIAPIISFSPNNCGASASVTSMGQDNANAGSNGGGTYGRILGITRNFGSPYMYATTSVWQASAPSAPAKPVETVTIQTPPIDTLAILTDGSIPTTGTNSTPGYTARTVGASTLSPTWASGSLNNVIDAYIAQANTEITAIKTNNPLGSTALNDYYNQTGTALTLEQRAREVCYDPVPVPKNTQLSKFPTTLYAFIDGVPTYSVNTEPHMYAQTLEAISDHTLIGGQSMVGMMRQERNQARLLEAGIQLDNNISGDLDPLSTKILIANGVLTTSHGTTPVANMYPPPDQLGIYDPVPDRYYITDPGLISGVDTPADDGIGQPAGVDGVSGINTATLPSPLPTGAAEEPGSLAGSRYQNIIPTQLNTAYTSGVLPSSVYSVKEAIDQVIKCNCDCWIN